MNVRHFKTGREGVLVSRVDANGRVDIYFPDVQVVENRWRLYVGHGNSSTNTNQGKLLNALARLVY